MAEQKKTDTEILFPELTYDLSIGKVTIKPFTYGDIIDLSKNLEQILGEFKARDMYFDLAQMNFSDLLSVYLMVAEPAFPIIVRVTGLGEEDVRKLTVGEAAQIMLAVVQQNMEIFMRFFAQSFGMSGQKEAKPTTSESNESAEKPKVEETT